MKRLVLLLIVLLIAGCSSNLVIIDDGMVLNENICNKIDYDVLIIHETGCLYCEKALPILEEIEKENNLSFKYLDIIKKEDLNYMLEKGFTAQKIPGIIYNCKVYMGAKSKEEYLEILKNG